MKKLLRIMTIAALCGTIIVSCTGRNTDAAQSLYEQGKALREQDKPVQAMAAFLQASECNTHDGMLLGRVWSNMANICRLAGEHNKAYVAYTRSAEHFLASHDSLAYAYALNNMAWEQAALAHKDSALLLIGRAVAACPQQPLTDKVRETHAAACWFVQEYDSVLYYTARLDSEYHKMLRAQAYSCLGQGDSATFYARQLLPAVTTPSYLDDIYYILTHDDPDTDTETLRTLASERADVQKRIEQQHGKLMLAVQLLDDNMASRRTDKNVWTALLIALLAAMMALAALIMRREHKQLLHDWRRREQARQAELEQNIKLLLETNDLKRELQWQDFAAFCHTTDKLFHGLATSLQSAGLNEQDVRICVLVLIGLPHKQIAAMLPCSQKSIGKLKDLTAHKLGVSGGQLLKTLKAMITDSK